MKIAFDVSYVQRKRAGIGRHALQLLKSLVVADPANEFLLHGWSFGLDVDELSKLERPSVKLSVARIPGNVKRFWWNSLRVPAIESVLGDVQIFHSADPSLPPTRRSKTIATVHDLSYKKFPEMFEPRVVAWDKFVRRSVQTADALIVPSEQTRDDLVELLNARREKIHVVHIPVDGIFTSEKIERDKSTLLRFGLSKPYMLFTGTIEPRKNIPGIIEAFDRLQDESHPDIDLVFAGKKGWLFDESLRAIRSSKYGTRLHYLEYVDDASLAALYRNALLFVYPSFYEGYGFPLLEAMASGIPIITSNNSSMRELADGVALLVDPGSIDDLVEAMNFLVTDEVRRVEMRQRGLYVVQQFSGSTAAKTTLDLYHSLI